VRKKTNQSQSAREMLQMQAAFRSYSGEHREAMRLEG
jgi:hypothetical protein